MFDEIGSRQDATAAALQMLVNSGLLTPDPRLEAFIRESSGLPGPDPDAEPPPEPEPQPIPAPVASRTQWPDSRRAHSRRAKGDPTPRQETCSMVGRIPAWYQIRNAAAGADGPAEI